MRIFGKSCKASGNSQSEAALRNFYLKQDITQSRIVSLLLMTFFAGFIINDYAFYYFTPTFWFLTATRAVLVLVIGFGWVELARTTEFQKYDRLLFAIVLAAIVCGGIINASRPDNFLLHTIVTLVSVFILYLVVPMRYAHQFFLATFMTIGEISIILLLTSNPETQIVYTLALNLIIANIIAAVCSWRFHAYRKETFKAFSQRKALQDSLKQQADKLSDLVKEQTDELTKTHSRLMQSERMAAIGATAGMVGHDIRNPLQAIVNDVFIAKTEVDLLADSDVKKNIQESLQEIEINIDYINKIVQDLQDYARPLNPNLEATSIEAIVDKIIQKNSLPSSIHFKIRVADEAKTVLTDSYYLNRILYNLITNAIQAMPNGGTLSVDAIKKEKTIALSIQDTGVGIPEAVQPKVFTVMFTTKSKGQGFGLPVVKRMTESLGGKVSFETTEGKGTKFMIELPINSS